MNTRNDHDWAVSRLTRFAAGLLPEDETLAMQEHLDTCGDCVARLAPARAASRDEAGHLPASLIATWNRSAGRLSGSERELVRHHLERCDSCRQTLVFAGHAPELPTLAEPAVRRPQRTAFTNLRQWAFGVSAVAAAAAVWMLVVQPAMRPRDPRVSATMGGARLDAAVWFEPLGAGLPMPADAIVLPAGLDPAPITIDPAALTTGRTLVLPAGLASTTNGAPARELTLTLLRGTAPVGAFRTTTMAVGGALVMRSRSVLEPGDYTLQIVAGTAGDADASEHTWVLRVQ